MRHNSIVHIVMLRAAVLVKRSLLTTHMREAGVQLQAVRNNDQPERVRGQKQAQLRTCASVTMDSDYLP